MTPLTFSTESRDDLAGTFDYGVTLFGLAATEAYVARFDAVFDMIRAYPLTGALHDNVRPPIRSLRCGSHRVYYDVLRDRAVVRRVLHQAMDIERHL